MIGDISHVCNRGFEKSLIFLDESDNFRFVHSLYRLNNKNGALKASKRDVFTHPLSDPLVDILKWSLLPNHPHLLLHEKIEGGIIEFVKRLGNSYTKYFNIKYDRNGYLFQHKARVVQILNNPHLNYIPFYIELNPLDMFDKKWRNNGINDASGCLNFLRNYRWSSYQDYAGIENFPSIINKSLYYELFDHSPENFENEIIDFMSDPHCQRATLT